MCSVYNLHLKKVTEKSLCFNNQDTCLWSPWVHATETRAPHYTAALSHSVLYHIIYTVDVVLQQCRFCG